MNIFLLDYDHFKCARYHNDRHIVKMPIESAQMLCTAQSLYGIYYNEFYRSTHLHHPCTIWTAQSIENYTWHYEHWLSLCREYSYRYHKTHKVEIKFRQILSRPPYGMMSLGLTPFVKAMPEHLKVDDPVESYRSYYRWMKRHIAVWSRPADKPEWYF